MKIKARDLRIGNNVICEINGVIKVNQATLCDFANGFIKLSAIPLTEEWLLKFGFDVDEIGTLFKDVNSNCFLCFEKGKVELLESESQVVLAKIKYIHQLQNLYYSLTGQELTYKS